MKRALLALVTLLAACAGETRYVEGTDQDDAWLRDAAAENWAAVGVEAPVDYSVIYLDQETLLDACNVAAPKQGGTIGGCAPEGAGAVLLWNGADPELQVSIVVHELGHMLRGGEAHLDCPETDGGRLSGNDMMCLTRAPLGSLPTARDAAFVTRN
jgi:hypothetical protein